MEVRSRVRVIIGIVGRDWKHLAVKSIESCMCFQFAVELGK